MTEMKLYALYGYYHGSYFVTNSVGCDEKEAIKRFEDQSYGNILLGPYEAREVKIGGVKITLEESVSVK